MMAAVKSPETWIGVGVIQAVAGLVTAVLFKLLVVHPAYTLTPDGRYGEWYGPVAYLRVPVYAACGLLFAAGLTAVVGGVLKRGQPGFRVFR